MRSYRCRRHAPTRPPATAAAMHKPRPASCSRLLDASAQPPHLGIAVSVEAAYDHGLFTLDGVEDAVWKPAQQRPSEGPVNHGRTLRKLLDLLNDRLETREEVSTQVRRTFPRTRRGHDRGPPRP